MSKKNKVKILVGYHKPGMLFKNDILVPIHLGRALATEASKDGKMSQEDYQWMLDNMIGDDTGDNISYLNRKFCEITGMYWAWKNYDKLGNPDYIGFMHYRRILDLNEKKEFQNNSNDSFIYDEVFDYSKYGLTENHIISIVEKNDIVEGNIFLRSDTVVEQLKSGHSTSEMQDFFSAVSYAKRKYVKVAGIIDEYLNSKKHHFCNCFIMKKELFFELCEFLFDICFYLENSISYQYKSLFSTREISFFSERFIGMYINFLEYCQNKKVSRYAIKYYERQEQKPFKPFKSNNNIPIILSADKNYAPYLSVLIKSIIDNAQTSNNYDIIVLEENILLQQKEKILKMNNSKNVLIRFYNIANLLKGKTFPINDYFSKETYFRIFIADLLPLYTKIIYLDVDMIVTKDLANLYQMDISNNILAATINYSTVWKIFKNVTVKGKNLRKYFTEELKLKDPYKYIQAGVMLLNLKKMRKIKFFDRFMQKLNEIKNPLFVDQDIINAIAQDDIKFISQKWNVEWMVPLDVYNCPSNFLIKYNESLTDPYIIHFDGSGKAWGYPSGRFADLWWYYARQTPFYEEILYKNLKGNSIQDIKQQVTQQIAKVVDNNIIKDIANYSKNRFNYYRCRLLANVTFGKMRKHYKNKKKLLKAKIKAVRKFLKG